MKRILSVILSIALVVCALVGCTVGFPTFTALPSAGGNFQAPTPSPSPTPAPRVIALFGAEDAEEFVAGVQSAAADAGVEIEVVAGGIEALSGYAPEGDAVGIVYLTDKAETLPNAGFPVYAYAADGQSVSGGVPYLGYDGSSEAQVALSSAIAYPPHLAPVRMIGLFTSQASAAYALYSGEKATGQVFSKEEFFADASDVVLTDWLNEVFSRYYPGMLDAVYAETGELALAAADTLASLGRSDLEVFCAESSAVLRGKLSPILVAIVGANEQEAGIRCFAEAKKLLDGGSAQSGILLPEAILYSPKP